MNEADLRASVERYVTKERLGPYLDETDGDYERAGSLYLWNLRVAGAFHETLGVFEVTLRNALCEQLRHWHGKRPGSWLDDPTSVFADGRIEQIDAARRRVRHAGKPESEGRVVAELSLGFWRYLLTKRYRNTLWNGYLRKAFPCMKPQRLNIVYDSVDSLHKLRNRVAHHEPIHRYPLVDLHDRLLSTIGWIDPHIAEWTGNLSRVPSVLASRPE